MSLNNAKVAVVIGGTKGMGRATSLALARDGYQVLACSKTKADVEALCAEGASEGLRIDGMVCNVEHDAELGGFIEAADAKYGRIDAMVFAVGKAFSGNALQLSAQEWDACFHLNLRAPFLAAKHTLPVMIRGGGGSMVFISTIWAFTTPRDRLAYLTAKSGLTALVRGLAIDHGSDGVRVNAVAPGYVDTEFLHNSIRAVHGEDKIDEVLAEVYKAHPLGKMVKPEDVANTIAFLASDRAAGISGQTVVVDGGSIAKFSLADAWSRKP